MPGKCVEAPSPTQYGWSDGVVSDEFAAALAWDLSLADVSPFSSLRNILDASESLLDLGSEPSGDNRGKTIWLTSSPVSGLGDASRKYIWINNQTDVLQMAQDHRLDIGTLAPLTRLGTVFGANAFHLDGCQIRLFQNSSELTLAARQTVHALAPRTTGGFLRRCRSTKQ